MYIDGKQGLLATEEEHAGGGFWADAFKAVQPGGTLCYWKAAQEIEVEVAAFFGDLAHDGLQAWRFYLRPVDVGNGFLYLCGWGISYSLPGTKAFQKVLAGSSSLLVSRAVREKNIHQLTHGVFTGEGKFAIQFCQTLSYLESF